MDSFKKSSTKGFLIKFSICFVVFSPALIYLFLYEFRGLGGLFLLLLGNILSLIVIIMGIVQLNKKKHSTILSIGLCLLISNWSSLFIAGHINDYELRITQERGDIIIKALDLYYEANRSYPRDLDELTKQNYGIVTMTYHIVLKGEKFQYSIDDKGGFVLSYSKAPYIPMRYYSRYRQWRVEPLG
jgi:hypothetical protein